MHNIYIVLSMSGTKFSKFLRFFSNLEYTHVSLSLEPNLNTLYSFGRRKLRCPWVAGFVKEHPNEGIFDIYNPECEILELQISEDSYNLILEELHYAELNYHSLKYNFIGLVFTYFTIPRSLKYRYTCTQFIAYLLDKSKSFEFDKHISLVLPNDYYNLPCKSIYKGKLNSYNKYIKVYRG